MSWMRGLTLWLHAVLRRSRADAELDDELRDHAERELERQLNGGWHIDHAARAARWRMGNIEAAKDAVRDERGGRLIADAVNDVRIGWKGWRRDPGFALAVVVSLALGVGGTTAIFSVVHAVLLRSLPYPGSTDLHVVRVWWNDFSASVSAADFVALNEAAQSVGRVGGFFYPDAGFTTPTPSGPEVVEGAFVTSGLIDVLGIRPIVGAGFTSDSAADKVLISRSLWIRRFAGAGDVVGRAITLDGQSYSIAGVMPAGFDVPKLSRAGDVWVRGQLPPPKRRGPYFMHLVIRLNPGIDAEAAAPRLTEIATPILQERYAIKPTWRYGLRSLHDTVVGDARGTLVLALGAVGLVLIVAILNVSNLLVARGTARSRELAVRASLGAGRSRLARQLLAESALLGLIGGVTGLLLAEMAVGIVRDAALEIVPRMDEVRVSGPVVAFAIALGLVASLAAGLLPALRLPWRGLTASLREGGRQAGEGRHPFAIRRVLVATEIAIALTVVAGASLLAMSLARLENTNPGFDADGVLSFRLSLPNRAYDRPRTATFVTTLDSRLREISRTLEVSYASGLPPNRSEWMNNYTFEGSLPDSRGPTLVTNHMVVSPGYFKTLAIPILRGRDFAPLDRDDTPDVAIVNEMLARRQYPGQDPIGKRLKGGDWNAKEPWTTIVGVVGDVPYGPGGVWRGAAPTVYTPYAQNLWVNSPYVLLKTTGDPASVVATARAAVLATDPGLPLRDVATMQERLRASTLLPRFRSVVAYALAGIAFALAVTGVYGVMSYHVNQRRRETAIRRALGAGRTQVVGAVVGAGAQLAGIGIAFGIVGALAAMGSLRTVLYQVAEHDPRVLVSAAVGLLASAVLSCAVPAMRAARVDPMIILRDE
jgi:putative ABC transport system permease protein